ncbi:YbjN domain-containing protein [Aurantimonas sp. A2-1-M11]|uniref:YbjN domain-containing protein n=1 Tax=Aurantimonas sp. A2-1-M11 TaxID=3113712 RepID=UPI002F943545
MTLFLCLCLAGTARAQSLVKAGDVDQIVDIARGFGSGTLEKEDNIFVRGRIDGTLYAVFFNDCNADRSECQSLQFYASWDGSEIDPAAINGWNRDKRFAKAYLDAENEPVLEMDVNLRHGVTRGNLEDTFDWWRLSLKEFQTTLLKQ